jgi:hypothetical protein
LKELKAIEGGRDFSTRTKGWWVKVKDKSDQLWSWYRDLSAIKKVLWGLIVIPVVVVIVGVNVLLAPIIAPLLPLIGAGLITLMKLTFVLTKFGASRSSGRLRSTSATRSSRAALGSTIVSAGA